MNDRPMNNDATPNEPETVPSVDQAFGSLKRDAANVDSMTALHTVQQRSKPFWTRPGAIVAAGLAVVLVVGGIFAIRGNDPTDSVATGNGDADDAQGLEGSSWTLMSGSGPEGDVVLVDDWPITLTFEPGRLGGTAACNGYGGSYSLDGDRLTINELSNTEMGCEPAVHAAESAFLQALLDVDTLVIDGNELLLTGPESELLFALDEPVPAAQLVGQLWLLDTIIQGDSASTVQGDPATLLLRSDGTLSGSTGCRSLGGEYIISGSEVTPTTFGAEGECSPELAKQDSFVIGVLEGFTVEIDGDRLTLTAAGGDGLSYQAIPEDEIPEAEGPDPTPTAGPTPPPLTVDELLDLRPREQVTVTGLVITYGGTTILCAADEPDTNDPTRCPGRWVTVTNYNDLVDSGDALSGVLRDDGRFQIVGPGSGVEERPSGVELTAEEADLLERLSVGFFERPAVDNSNGWLHPDGVTLWLGQTQAQTLTAAEIGTYTNWTIDPGTEGFEGFAGPFNVFDLLERGDPVEFLAGPHDHCAGQPRLLPTELQGLRQLSIQPTGIDSCIQWYSIDVFVDEDGLAKAIMLDLFGP